jgi:hypothetical protein
LLLLLCNWGRFLLFGGSFLLFRTLQEAPNLFLVHTRLLQHLLSCLVSSLAIPSFHALGTGKQLTRLAAMAGQLTLGLLVTAEMIIAINFDSAEVA